MPSATEMAYISDAVHVAASLDEVWHFFSVPQNLVLLTPPDQHLRVDAGGRDPLQEGAVIRVSVAPVARIRMRWKTVIGAVMPPGPDGVAWFRDTQEQGPFARWDHLHAFKAHPDGGTVIVDQVDYQVPMGRVGSLMAGAWVRSRIGALFAFRRTALLDRFGHGTGDLAALGAEWIPAVGHSPGMDRESGHPGASGGKEGPQG